MELVPLFIGVDDFTTNNAALQLEEYGILSIPISKGKIPYRTGLKVKATDYEKAMEILRDLELVNPKFFY